MGKLLSVFAFNKIEQFFFSGKYKHNHQEKNNWVNIISVAPQTQNSFSFCQKDHQCRKLYLLRQSLLSLEDMQRKGKRQLTLSRAIIFLCLFCKLLQSILLLRVTSTEKFALTRKKFKYKHKMLLKK